MTPSDWRPLLRAALAEDLGRAGDVTTRFFVPAGARLSARIVSRERGVVCGLAVAAAAFKACEPRARVRLLVRDGARVRPGQAVLAVTGGRGILTAERTALNFLQRMSGVATLTRAFVDRVKGTRARILDTRKTLPGWRALDKYAVACGGGLNHRLGLHDAAMVKDNHYGGDLAAGAARLRRAFPRMPLIVECDSPAQATRALSLRPDVILLDNMRGPRLRREIRRIRSLDARVKIEVSGGVGLSEVRALARLGPDRISIGRLTHSAPALDLGLDLA
ncbi:MAG: carboxylating nicotinate-nucleotide diphosphorylase [Elusimicrobiota bacterium]|nr:MAG: carboxylating nicotinate-nucleotide diphosphorylase [Elusimicrobiota bacterium]